MRRALAVVPLMAVAAAVQQGGLVPWGRPSARASEAGDALEPVIEVRRLGLLDNGLRARARPSAVHRALVLPKAELAL